MKKAQLILPMLPLVCSISVLQQARAADADAQAAMRIEPVFTVSDSGTGSDALYRLGRRFQDEDRLDEAADAYRRALDRDPRHVDARNGLASIHAARGQFNEAQAGLRAILQQDPSLAYIHNNLGYTYLLQQDYVAAVAELKEALVLDPENAVAAANIAYVRKLMGEADSPAPAQLADANTAEGMNSAAPMATPAAATAVADNGSDVLAENDSNLAPAQVEDIAQPASLTNAALPIAESTSRSEPSTTARDAFAQSVQTALAGRNIRIEVANGTRNAWLTGDVARMLSGSGLKVTRTENLKPYTQRRTVILYRDGYREEAIALARSFAVPPAIAKDIHVRNPMHKFELRLVLGKTALQVTQLAQRDAGNCDGGSEQCKP